MPLKLDNLDLSKHVIILTGATDGIGKEMARILAGFNPKRLILPARNIEKGNNLLEYIKSSNGNANNVEIWEMDLADLQSVKNFANKFINEIGELHILINNAGVGVQSRVIKTKDNFELQFQVNHLAPFLLIWSLLDTMKRSVSAELPGKIAFTTSVANQFGEIDFDNLNLEKNNYWHPFKGRIVQSETEITAEQGAINVLYPVFSLETGNYYNEGIEDEPNKIAYDQEIAKKLWDVSEQILKDHGMI
ncbi:17036_t:CDS:2 [Rhizophagus irregularis]|nr:17036_t:CDS:2 [Rhizophagus irregularis]